MDRQHQVSLKFKHIKVQVISGYFYEERTDVVVNSTSQNLRLQDGMGSKALLNAAGNQIQQELSEKYPDGVQCGDIAISGGHNLYCCLVYHCSLRRWTQSSREEAEKIYKQIILFSLKKADETEGVQSITFPALGRGYNNFGAQNIAKLMFQCVADFEESLVKEPSVKDVRFVVYPEDHEAVEAFKEEAKQRCKNVVTTMEYSSNLGHVKVTLMQGSMTKHMCDVVVNETLENLDLSRSPISESAGPDLEKSLRANAGGTLEYHKIAVTGAANLTNCVAVYHGSLPLYTEQTKTECKEAINILVMQCLMEATESGFMTISFPPLGTDLKSYPPEFSAEAIQGSIIEYLSGNSDTTTVQHIYLIIQPSARNIFKVFKDKLFPQNQRGRETLEQTLVAKSTSKSPEQRPQVPIPPLNLLQVAATIANRGSKPWLVKMYEEDLLTPIYWTYFPGGQRLKKLKIDTGFASKKPFTLVDVDQKTLQAIRSLVEKTWNEEFFSHGRDALGLGDLNYKKIKVTEVKRLENLNLFEKYCSFRQQMFGKALSQSKVFPTVNELPGSKGPLITTSQIDPCLTKDMYKEINEHYVFHGTKQENIEIILATGLDSRMAGPNAMFGPGVYAAESSTKADQYADDRYNRDMGPKNMFLTRMCMGDICIVKEAIRMKRPPCKSCRTTICPKECRNTKLFDSVLADGEWIFREMIVYDHAQCYPEFLITYHRIN